MLIAAIRPDGGQAGADQRQRWHKVLVVRVGSTTSPASSLFDVLDLDDEGNGVVPAPVRLCGLCGVQLSPDAHPLAKFCSIKHRASSMISSRPLGSGSKGPHLMYGEAAYAETSYAEASGLAAPIIVEVGQETRELIIAIEIELIQVVTA